MLYNIGHFIGVRGSASEEDFRTFTALSDSFSFDGEIGRFKNGGVLNASAVMKLCGLCKPRDRFIVAPKIEEYVCPTERFATCIEADKEKKRCYLIPHAFGEYVGFTKINNFGTHDGDVVSVKLPQLMHVKKVGVITAKALGGGGAQNFTIGIGDAGDDDDGEALVPANFIEFQNNTPANTVKMADCDCICSRITLNGDAVNANTGEGYVFCICDTNTTLEFESDTFAINSTDFIHIFPTRIYAKLLSCSWVGVTATALTGDNRFIVEKNNNTALTNAAALNGRPAPEGAGLNIISGEIVKIRQSVADSTNSLATVKFRLDFSL